MRLKEHNILWLLLLIPAIAFAPPTKVRASGSKTRSSLSVALNAARRNIIVLSHNVSQDVSDGLFDVNSLLTGRVDVLTRCANSALWVSNGIRKDTSVFLMLFPHNITIEIRGKEVIDLNPDERTMALCLQRTLLADGGNRDTDGSNDIDNNQDLSAMKIEQEKKQERCRVELESLRETKRGRPDTLNPHKPGSLSKSEKRAFRITRKAREAMMRRIRRSSGDSPPQGFIIHRNDTLVARLQSLNGPALMLNELGEPLEGVLSDTHAHANSNWRNTKEFESTIILGDQIGYAACDEEVLAESDIVRQVSLGPLSLLTSQCITIMHHYLDINNEHGIETES